MKRVTLIKGVCASIGAAAKQVMINELDRSISAGSMRLSSIPPRLDISSSAVLRATSMRPRFNRMGGPASTIEPGCAAHKRGCTGRMGAVIERQIHIVMAPIGSTMA
jgi:hypothetical protein